jgi:hypothetical protein
MSMDSPCPALETSGMKIPSNNLQERKAKPAALYFELEDGSRTQTALFDGYPVGDRILENVMFIATVNNGKLDVKIHPDDKAYFSTLNESYWLNKVTDYVQDYDVFEHPETGEDVYLVTEEDV